MKDRIYVDDPQPELPLFANCTTEQKVDKVMNMIDKALFTDPKTGKSAPETSRLAAEVAGRTAKTLRADVFRFIKSTGEEGATANEVHLHFNLDKNSTSPRITELKQAGLIEDSGRRRASFGCGKSVIWIAKKQNP